MWNYSVKSSRNYHNEGMIIRIFSFRMQIIKYLQKLLCIKGTKAMLKCNDK